MARPLPLIALLLAACSGEEVELEVDHFRIPCFDEDEVTLCLFVAKVDDEGEVGDAVRILPPIDDFEFQWGRVVRMRAIEHQRPSPNTTIATVRYELVEELDVQKVAAGTRFTYPFNPDELPNDAEVITLDGDGGGELMDGRAFRCTDGATCDALDAALAGNDPIQVQFSYAADIDDPLIAMRVDTTP